MTVQILPEAEQDLIDGFSFYELQQPGLGRYFLDSLFSDIDSLEFFGGIHMNVHGYHRLLSKRFPFAVYYRVQNEQVQIYAVLDCRRSPAWVHDRLT
ncbi:MAG TPA: type II toxin-antitoxin system RelE/ParE family toxin [Tichowtungia sp.]|nr:type II toxin-antitoxin system RelE/ParE family toxin [Tichowtungia sp.]